MSTTVENTIKLQGSIDIVVEFFDYCVNNILFQRGIYPPENFKRVAHYGLSMMISTDEKLQVFMMNILSQLRGITNSTTHSFSFFTSTLINLIEWLLNNMAQKLVLVVKGTESGQPIERWAFDCTAEYSGE